MVDLILLVFMIVIFWLGFSAGHKYTSMRAMFADAYARIGALFGSKPDDKL